MARVDIELPDQFVFSTEVSVRITDLNYGQHLANDAVMALLHEGRMRFLNQFGYTELAISGSGLIMIDASIQFKTQSDFGDRIRIELTTAEWSYAGFEILYRLTNQRTNKEAVRAKTGMCFFNYTTGKIEGVPQGVRSLLEGRK